MGYPQSNQQTPFIGYPQNQLYNPQDLQYMQDTQKMFLDWGQWQPGMTTRSPSGDSQTLLMPTRRVLAPADAQSSISRALVRPTSRASGKPTGSRWAGSTTAASLRRKTLMSPFPGTPGYNKKMFEQPGGPWGALNSMGISSAYGMPAWQQDQFTGQNAGPGQPNNFEQFSLYPQGSSSKSSAEGCSLTGAGHQRPHTAASTPATPHNNPAAPEWMYPQQQNAWGTNSSNPWGSGGGWGGKGWGQ